MTLRLVVAGTDTGVGKTVFAAALTLALDAVYFKPVQSGLGEDTDEQTVRRLTGLAEEHFRPSVYRLKTPVSPHLSARIDGVRIDTVQLALPELSRPLVVEGAGGLMVPLNEEELYIDVLARWAVPVVLVARTTLGTINHSLLSLEALARRDIPVAGVAFVGESNRETESAIAERGGARRLGCLPWLQPVERAALARAFSDNFRLSDFGTP